jgi:hypothetical protein
MRNRGVKGDEEEEEEEEKRIKRNEVMRVRGYR